MVTASRESQVAVQIEALADRADEVELEHLAWRVVCKLAEVQTIVDGWERIRREHGRLSRAKLAAAAAILPTVERQAAELLDLLEKVKSDANE